MYVCWENEVSILVRNRMVCLKSKHAIWHKARKFTDSKHLEYLDSFKKQYVLVSALKNNIIVICKKYYCKVILQELKISSPSTYKLMHVEADSVISRHMNDLARWNILVPNEWQHLPVMYWLPK